MATVRLKHVKGRRFRMTKLDECGAHIVGSCSSIVSEGFVTITLTAEVEDGEETSQKNAWGDYCVAERDEPRIKWVTNEMVFCEVDPDVADFVGGGSVTPVVSGSDTIGFTVGPNRNGSAFAIEVWTKLGGQACGAGSPFWGYFAVPFNRNGIINGPVEAGKLLTFPMRADAIAAPASWATTPYTDNPLLRTGGFPAGEFYGMVRTTVQPPELTAGCAAIA